jgi:hypothetical protein
MTSPVNANERLYGVIAAILMKSTLKYIRYNEKERVDFMQENERQLIIMRRHTLTCKMNIMKRINHPLNFYRLNINRLRKSFVIIKYCFVEQTILKEVTEMNI